jgi:holo-ACP synthase/triphosphoribosyl-dephospho-CoA synthase
MRENENPSHGELVFAKNGIQGIRGEVSRGFPSVTEYALPMLCRLLNEGYSINDAGIAVLLNLMAHTEDTNIIYRRGIDVFRSIQEELRNFFATNPNMDAIRKKAASMDKEFISNNISPGGSADLLGTTFFLHRICMAKH